MRKSEKGKERGKEAFKSKRHSFKRDIEFEKQCVCVCVCVCVCEREREATD